MASILIETTFACRQTTALEEKKKNVVKGLVGRDPTYRFRIANSLVLGTAFTTIHVLSASGAD
jgi:hypothetical protein